MSVNAKAVKGFIKVAHNARNNSALEMKCRRQIIQFRICRFQKIESEK